MSERMISVTVPADLAELVTDRMWQWGVRGVEESTGASGEITLRTTVGNDGDAISHALGTLDPSWRWRVDDVDTTPPNGADDWKRFARPVRCRPDLVVVPAWWTDPVDEHAEVIRIDPGSAFGLGDHPTTRSSLRALADELDRRAEIGSPSHSLLDVGCGTGALAVLAARRGVDAVRAIDIAASAVEATVANAERNQVGGRIEVDRTPIGVLPIPEPDGYDVIVANILAPTLVGMADDLHRLLAPGGALIISGVLSSGHGHGHDHVLAALAPLEPASTIDDDGWATITLTDR